MARSETLFRIASLTKPVLAAATMMLVEEGQSWLRNAMASVATRCARCDAGSARPPVWPCRQSWRVE
ncbi:MAG: beta-lactamase family protein [Chloroflexi bacterium]|nr:MAG: beta-lactamase family protein [Chloroflexota bacterium]